MHAQLRELRDAFAGSPDLTALLENPEIDSRLKADVLADVAKGSDELSSTSSASSPRRAAQPRSPRSPTSSMRSSRRSERVLDVELTTATAARREDYYAQVISRIESASGRKVQASRKVDPDLIGGIVLQAGSMRLDASVRGRLERLRTDLSHARSQ